MSLSKQLPSRLTVKRKGKPSTSVSPRQVFVRDGVSYQIVIKKSGTVLTRDHFLRGQKSWERVFDLLIAGGSSLYGILHKLGEYK